ncbi:MAG: hypothetical protein ACI84C_002543, partial [Flavobacteriales bacterium]
MQKQNLKPNSLFFDVSSQVFQLSITQAFLRIHGH